MVQRTIRKLVKVPLYGQPAGKVAKIHDGATVGATIGTDLFYSDGSIVTLDNLRTALGVSTSSGGGASSLPLARTLWRLIQEIPENVLEVAALNTVGLVVRQTAGTWTTRAIAVADTARLTIANGDGDAGAPTLDLADVAALSVWGRAANSIGKPAPIASSSDDTVLRRTGATINFGQLTVGMAPNALWTYAKIQDATALSVLGRASNTGGVLADIVAGANDRLLARVANAVAFTQLTAGMFPALVVPDAALSANVPLLNAPNVFTADLTVSHAGDTAVVITATDASNAFLQLRTNSTTRGYLVAPGVASGFVTGSAVGDLALRAQSGRFIVSTDGGSTIALAVSNTEVAISSTLPILRLNDSNAGTDVKNWLYTNVSGDLIIATATDAAPTTRVSNALRVTRTSTTVDAVEINATAINLNGGVTMLGNVNTTFSMILDNDSNGTANSVRQGYSSGDANGAIFVGGSGRTAAIVTGGPLGANMVMRTLGAYPIIFGTDNTCRMRISQELTIADDATATFPVNSGIIMVSTSYGANTPAMFYVFTNTELTTIFAGTLVSIGSGSNPDVDGHVNLWKSATGTLSIKNRLGSARSFFVTTVCEF